MKPTLLSILSLLFPVWLTAQVSDTIVCIGKNHITGADITATRFDFPGVLYNIHISGKRNVVMTACSEIPGKGKRNRNTGEVNVISLDSDTVVFRYEFNDAHYIMEFSDEFMFKRERDSWFTEYMHPYPDIFRSRVKGAPVLTDYFDDMFLNLSPGALSLHNNDGIRLWKTKIDAKNGVKELIVEAADSALLVCSGGIRKINLAEGNGWKFKENTQVTEKGAVWKAIAAGVVSAAFSGAISGLSGSYVTMSWTPPITYYNNVCSNIKIHEGRVYWASMTRLVCLDYATGLIIWETPLKKRTMGSSEIMLADDRLWLINRGCIGPNSAFYEKRGISSVMVFDPDSGELNDSGLLEDIIVHYVINTETLELTFTGENGVYLFSLGDMENKAAYKFDYSGWDRPYLTRTDLFFKKELEDGFMWMYQFMPLETVPLRKNNEEVVFIDMRAGDEVTSCSLDDLYFMVGDFNNYSILSGPEGSVVMNMEQNKVSEFDCHSPIYRKDGYLVWHDEQYLYKVMLSDLIPDYSVGMEGELYYNDLIL